LWSANQVLANWRLGKLVGIQFCISDGKEVGWEIRAGILAVRKEAEGLLDEIPEGAAK
jgi:hypothetical protein